MNAQDFFKRGVENFNAGQYQAALADLNEAMKLRTTPDADDYYWRGRIYCALSQYQAAFADFNQLITLRTTPGVEDYHWRGTTYYQLEQYQAALADLNEAMKLQIPPDAANYGWRGITYYQLGQYQAALADLNEAMKLRTTPFAVDYYGRGRTYYQLGQYQEALADLKEAMKLRTAPFAADYHWRGRTYYQLGRYQEALADLKEAMKLRTAPFAADYHWRGITYCRLGQYQEALADLKEAMKLRTAPFAADYHWRGRAYYQLGQYPEALTDLNQYIQLVENPPSPHCYYWRAQVHAAMGNDTATIADCQQVLQYEKKPEHQAIQQKAKRLLVNVLLAKATQQLETQNFEEAVTCFTQVLECAPENIESYVGRAAALISLNRYQEVLEDYNNILNAYSSFGEGYFERGDIYCILEQDEKAISDYTLAIQYNFQNSEVYAKRGKLHFKLKRYEAAIADYQQAILLDKDNSTYANQLADAKAALAQEQAKQAERAYQQGQDFVQQKCWEAALPCFNQALQLETLACYFAARSQVHYQLKQYELALADAQQALTLDNSLVAIYHLRGLLYIALQANDAGYAANAVADLEVALANRYEITETQHQLSRLYASQKQYHKLLNLLEQAPINLPELQLEALFYVARFSEAMIKANECIQAGPPTAQVYYFRGLAQVALAEYSAALLDFGRYILQQKPTDTLRLNRAYCYLQLGRWQEAIKDFTALMNQEVAAGPSGPMQAPALYWACRGQAYLGTGDFIQAIADLEQTNMLLELGAPRLPANIWVSEAQIEILLDVSGLLTKAQQQYRGSEQQKAAQQVELARHHCGLGNYALTLDFCQKALIYQADCHEAYFMQAQAYQQLEQWDKAYTSYQNVLQLNPAHSEAAQGVGQAQAKLQALKAEAAHQSWLEQEAAQAIVQQAIKGAIQGLPAYPEFNLRMVEGICKQGFLPKEQEAELSKLIVLLIEHTHLLTPSFKPEHVLLAAHKLSEKIRGYLNIGRQQYISAERSLAEQPLRLTKPVSDPQLRESLLKALHNVRQKLEDTGEQAPRLMARSQVPGVTSMLQQPEAPLPFIKLQDDQQSSQLIPSLFEDGYLVPNTWRVALMRSKFKIDNYNHPKHAYLLVLGVSQENGQRNLIARRYEFMQNGTNKHCGIVIIKEACTALTQLETSQSYIIKQSQLILKLGGTEKLTNRFYQAWPIPSKLSEPENSNEPVQSNTELKKDCVSLHNLVLEDDIKARNKEIAYQVCGNRAVPTYFVSRAGHNCFTWAREKLSQVGIELKSDWLNNVADLIASDPERYLPATTETRRGCLIM